MLLKDILTEINKEDAALEYLSNLVKSGPFKNRVFLAGGAPRDMELGMSPKDLDVVVKGDSNAGIDFATWATKEIGNFKDGSNPVIFPKFFTSKFTLKGVTYKGHDLSDVDVEAVAPRKEKYTPGSRKPEVSAGELGDDVHRRDFTVNSLLRDLSSGEVLDLTGMGKDDIRAGIVRTPLDPDVIFTDDPLRTLRAIRFTAKYNWKLPMFMIKSIKKNASQLTNISKERIHDEVNKMILTQYPYKAFRLMQILGVMKYVFPVLESENLKYMLVIKSLDKDLPLRLAATLKNISPAVIRSSLNELKYSLDITNRVIKIVNALPTLIKVSDNVSDEYLRTMRLDSSDIMDDVVKLAVAYNPNIDGNSIMYRYQKLSAIMDSNKIPVSGQDIIDLGVKPGPVFKKILDAVRLQYIKNPQTPKEEFVKTIKSFLG